MLPDQSKDMPNETHERWESSQLTTVSSREQEGRIADNYDFWVL
jgi:hypothetical protein